MTSWVPCEVCKRTPGRVRMVGGKVVSDALGWTPAESSPCPACSGLGELPSEGLVEAAAKAGAELKLPDSKKFGPLPITIWDNLEPGQQVIHRMWARAALVAARLYESREK